MHDIDRGANPTAMRLAALAALRHAQGEDSSETEAPGDRGGLARASSDPERRPGKPAKGAKSASQEAAASAPERPVGVYAAVEAALKRSRVEFLARLREYRGKLDCEAFKAAGADGLGRSLDEAQFVAHRIAGVGKTLGFAELGDHARQAEAAISAYKLESTADLRHTAILRVCKLVRQIEATCAEHEGCQV